MKITKEQIKAIHTLKHSLKWDDEAYRSFLDGHFGAESCTELTTHQATAAIKVLSEVLEEADRSTKVTTKQISYIRFLWLQVDYGNAEEGDRYLSSFLFKKYKVKKPEQLSASQAFGAISAIKRMIEIAKTRKVKVANNIVRDEKTGDSFVWVTLEDGTRVKQKVFLNNKGS